MGFIVGQNRKNIKRIVSNFKKHSHGVKCRIDHLRNGKFKIVLKLRKGLYDVQLTEDYTDMSYFDWIQSHFNNILRELHNLDTEAFRLVVEGRWKDSKKKVRSIVQILDKEMIENAGGEPQVIIDEVRKHYNYPSDDEYEELPEGREDASMTPRESNHREDNRRQRRHRGGERRHRGGHRKNRQRDNSRDRDYRDYDRDRSRSRSNERYNRRR